MLELLFTPVFGLALAPGDEVETTAPVVTDADAAFEGALAEPPAPHREHATPRPDDGPEVGPWLLGGFVDTAYQGSTNQPDNHVWRGNFTTPRTNEITLNLAALYVRRDPGPRDPFHLEIALHIGPAADVLVSGEPTPGGADSRFTGPETWKNIARANAGLAFDSGTDVTAGLLVCPIGLGGFWTLPNWTYSAPWSSNGVPYYLAGGRLSQDIAGKVSLQGWVVNGWQTLGDINKVPSYLAGIVITPRKEVTLQEMVYFGAEDIDLSPRAWRVHVNTQATWNTERFGIAGLIDVGRERLTLEPGEPVALWLATVAMARWRVMGTRHTWDMATRVEGYWDRDGRMYGVRQWLVDASYINDVRLFDHVLLRLEYRYDHSTAADGFFYRHAATSDASPDLAKDQHTLIAALTGYFEIGLRGMRPPR